MDSKGSYFMRHSIRNLLDSTVLYDILILVVYIYEGSIFIHSVSVNNPLLWNTSFIVANAFILCHDLKSFKGSLSVTNINATLRWIIGAILTRGSTSCRFITSEFMCCRINFEIPSRHCFIS
jgi:hypothetical protein